jgi:hypothetical protein
MTKEALSQSDVIMLDNFSLDDMKGDLISEKHDSFGMVNLDNERNSRNRSDLFQWLPNPQCKLIY